MLCESDATTSVLEIAFGTYCFSTLWRLGYYPQSGLVGGGKVRDVEQ